MFHPGDILFCERNGIERVVLLRPIRDPRGVVDCWYVRPERDPRNCAEFIAPLADLSADPAPLAARHPARRGAAVPCVTAASAAASPPQLELFVV